MTNAKGIDVSVYNGIVSSALVAQVDFVIARASIGASPDARYAANAYATLHGGKVLGAYHFAVYGPGPTRQANTFLANAHNAAFLVVDDEGASLTHPATVRAIIANLHLRDPQKRHVGLYSSDGTWPGDLGQDFDWVANWSHVPARHWTFWQNSGTKLDHDQYNGTATALQAWAKTRRA